MMIIWKSSKLKFVSRFFFSIWDYVKKVFQVFFEVQECPVINIPCIMWLVHTDLKWQIWRNNCFNGKTCKFDSDISDFNSVDLKKTKKIIKGQIFFQRPNLKAKGQKFQILWFFQWFGLVCKQLFRKSHWFK